MHPIDVLRMHRVFAEDIAGNSGGVDDSDVADDLEKARNAESVAAAVMVEERVYFHISVHKASWQIMLAASWVMLAALLDAEDVEDDPGARGMSARLAKQSPTTTSSSSRYCDLTIASTTAFPAGCWLSTFLCVHIRPCST